MRHRVFPLLLLAGFLVGASLLVWQRGAGTGKGLGWASAAALPGGGELVLWRPSYGTNHELVIGRFPALDPLRRWRPWVPRWLGPETHRLSATGGWDELCLFYSALDSSGTWSSDPPWAQAVIDEHGCRLLIDQGRGSSSHGGVDYVHQQTPVYPRRAREFEVVFGEYRPATNDVRMRLRNPRPWKGTDWTPEPFPVTREVEGLRLTLLGFGGSADWPWPEFRVEENGVLRKEWRVGRTWFADVTGNRAQSATLCRHEPAWRIEAGFERVTEFAFGPDELWTVYEGDVPAAGAAVEFGESRELGGVTARVVAFGGPGVFGFESRGSEWQLTTSSNLPSGEVGRGSSWRTEGTVTWMTLRDSKPWVALTLRGLGPDHVWQMAWEDETGKHHRNSGWSSSGSLYTCELGLPDGVRRGRLKFIVQRLRMATFTVPPPPPQEPARDQSTTKQGPGRTAAVLQPEPTSPR